MFLRILLIQQLVFALLTSHRVVTMIQHDFCVMLDHRNIKRFFYNGQSDRWIVSTIYNDIYSFHSSNPIEIGQGYTTDWNLTYHQNDETLIAGYYLGVPDSYFEIYQKKSSTKAELRVEPTGSIELLHEKILFCDDVNLTDLFRSAQDMYFIDARVLLPLPDLGVEPECFKALLVWTQNTAIMISPIGMREPCETKGYQYLISELHFNNNKQLDLLGAFGGRLVLRENFNRYHYYNILIHFNQSEMSLSANIVTEPRISPKINEFVAVCTTSKKNVNPLILWLVFISFVVCSSIITGLITYALVSKKRQTKRLRKSKSPKLKVSKKRFKKNLTAQSNFPSGFNSGELSSLNIDSSQTKTEFRTLLLSKMIPALAKPVKAKALKSSKPRQTSSSISTLLPIDLPLKSNASDTSIITVYSDGSTGQANNTSR